MNRISKYLFTCLIGFILFVGNVFAADMQINVTSQSVTEGNTITLTIKGNDLAGKFSVISSNPSVASLSSGSVWIDKSTESVTISAKSPGTSVITVSSVDATSYSGDPFKDTKTITITVNKKQVATNNSKPYTPAPKSSNNYLSSITVDGFELDSKFSKESLDYTLMAKEGTEKIKINAQLEDSRASVIGIGEKEVSEGVNNFSLVVTAENGSKRTYNLKVTVKEYKPIEVKIDNEVLTVVRKKDKLPKISEYFTNADIKIGEEVVPGYINEQLNYSLVALKDDLGNIEYYIYKDGKYNFYNEQTFNGTTVQILDKKVDGNYKKTTFKYNDKKIDSYQESKIDLLKNTYALDNNDTLKNDFYLFYGINLETGKEQLYQYDSKEKTIQRYNLELIKMYKDTNQVYYLLSLGLVILLGMTIILFSILLSKKNKKKEKSKIIDKKKDEKKETKEK